MAKGARWSTLPIPDDIAPGHAAELYASIAHQINANGISRLKTLRYSGNLHIVDATDGNGFHYLIVANWSTPQPLVDAILGEWDGVHWRIESWLASVDKILTRKVGPPEARDLARRMSFIRQKHAESPSPDTEAELKKAHGELEDMAFGEKLNRALGI